eukprot:10212258-Ditylum_brightwellii.AAC.1
MAQYMFHQQFGWYPMWSNAPVAVILALYNEQVPDAPPVPPEVYILQIESVIFESNMQMAASWTIP